MRKKMISLMMTVAMGTVMISGATVVKADSDEKETVKLAVWSSGAADNFQKGADEFNKRQDKNSFLLPALSFCYFRSTSFVNNIVPTFAFFFHTSDYDKTYTFFYLYSKKTQATFL